MATQGQQQNAAIQQQNATLAQQTAALFSLTEENKAARLQQASDNKAALEQQAAHNTALVGAMHTGFASIPQQVCSLTPSVELQELSLILPNVGHYIIGTMFSCRQLTCQEQTAH